MGLAFDVAQTRTTLFGALIDARDRFGRDRPALEDAERNPLTYGRLVLGALVFGRKLAPITAPGEPVGVLLPNMQGLAVVLFAL
ncbi:MAG: 2-acylglycerophosphoethanolamine acyltransferase, partial [Microvirga sp.]